MKTFRTKNSKVSGVIKSNDIMLNSIVIKKVRCRGEVRVFRKLANGTLKELKKVSSVELSKTTANSLANTNPGKTINNYPSTTHEDITQRKTDWLKFKAAVLKIGGLDIYTKSRQANSVIETILTKRPDFKNGMKLYEAGGNGAWALLSERSIESVRRTYQKYYMDLDLLLAA